MVRVKQFADDLGISKNQAKNLINKGRSRKDGGSQILESVMKKPVYAKNGKYTKSKVKKEEVLMSSDMPKKKPKNFKKTVNKIKMEKAIESGKFTIGDFNEMTEYDMKQFLKGNSTGTFKDITGDGKVTQKDVLKAKGVPGFSRGGGMAIQGLGFRGVK
jgi:hypothetical protein